MKIHQSDNFRPITITLETRDEALAVWTALRTNERVEMKIHQSDNFRPITITLETRDEALAVWTALRAELGKNARSDRNEQKWQGAILKELNDWFILRSPL